MHNGFTRFMTKLKPEFLVSYLPSVQNPLTTVALVKEDSQIEATYHTHKNIAGFLETLYIKTSTECSVKPLRISPKVVVMPNSWIKSL